MRSYGNPGRGRQRNQVFLSTILRGVSILREGSKILSFLFRPRLVRSSFLHLQSSWKVKSQKFAPGICSWHHDTYKRAPAGQEGKDNGR
jgi:hypothetical protein